MKKGFVLVLVVTMLICSIPVYAQGQKGENLDTSAVSKVYLLSSGVRLVEMVPEIQQRTRSSVTGSKSYNCIDSNNAIVWTAKLTASFYYDGGTSYATAASCTTTVLSGNWHESYNNAYYAGNVAYARVEMQLLFLFIVINTEEANLTLTCDANGNLT